MTDTLAQAVIVIDGDSKAAEDAMKKAGEHLKKLGQDVQEIGTKISEFFGIEVLALGAEALHAFGENEDSLAKLNGVINATGGSAGVTTEHIVEMANALQETTRFMHDQTQAAAALALTFRSIRNEAGAGNDVFDRTLKTSQDLATLMGGDLDSAITQLGRALEDPVQGLARLRRAGIVFSDSEQEQIREMYVMNDVLGAQKAILARVEDRVKGLSEAYRATPIGQLKGVWIELHEALEEVGKTIWTLVQPAVAAITDAIKRGLEWYKGLSDNVKDLLVMLIGLAAVVGPIMVLVGGIIAFAGALEAMGVAVAAIAITTGLWTAAIGLVIAASILLYKNWDRVKLGAAEFWAFMKDIFFSSIKWIIDKLVTFTGAVSELHSAFAFMEKIPGLSLIGFLGDLLGRAHGKMVELSDATDKWADESMANSQKQIEGLAAAVAKDTEGVKKNIEVKKEVTKREPVWAGAAKKALFEMDQAQINAADSAEVLGTQFDYAGAMGTSLQTAVSALQNAFVPLDAKLDDSGRSTRSLMLQFQTFQTRGTLDALQKSLQETGVESAGLGDAFDIGAAQSSLFESAIQALIQEGHGLTDDLGKQWRNLQNLINLKKVADIESAAHQFGEAQRESAIYAKALGLEFDSTGAAATNLGQEIQTLIQDHVQLNDVIDEQGTTLEDLMHHWQHLKDAAQITAALKDAFGSLSDFIVEFTFDSSKSFKDFVRGVLMDLEKLILRILFLRALKSIFGGTDIFGSAASVLSGGGGDVSGAAAVLSGGGISAGGAAALGVMSPQGFGGTVNANFNVSAIDQKGVSAFFEDNKGMIAGSLLTTLQQSATLRNRLGR